MGTLPRIVDTVLRILLNSEWGLWGSILLCIGLVLYLIYKSVLYAAFVLRVALLTSVAVIIVLGSFHLWLTKLAPVYLVLTTGEKGTVEPVLVYGLDQARFAQLDQPPISLDSLFGKHAIGNPEETFRLGDGNPEPNEQGLEPSSVLQFDQLIRGANCDATDDGCSFERDPRTEDDGDEDPYGPKDATSRHKKTKKQRDQEKDQGQEEDKEKEEEEEGKRRGKHSNEKAPPAKSNGKEEHRPKGGDKKEKRKANNKPTATTTTTTTTPPPALPTPLESPRRSGLRYYLWDIFDWVARILPRGN